LANSEELGHGEQTILESSQSGEVSPGMSLVLDVVANWQMQKS
jgi:hypothetical protein